MGVKIKTGNILPRSRLVEEGEEKVYTSLILSRNAHYPIQQDRKHAYACLMENAVGIAHICVILMKQSACLRPRSRTRQLKSVLKIFENRKSRGICREVIKTFT